MATIKFIEGAIQFLFANAMSARKFDETGASGHRMSKCMKQVDCIVEFEDRYLFIEVKDPQGDRSHTEEENKAFVDRFKSGEIDHDLKYKYRDSFLYEWALNRAEKPIDYYVLFADETLDDALLGDRSTALEKQLPVRGPGDSAWPRPFVRGCGVFNIALWNKHLPDYPVTRIPPTDAS